MRTPILFAALFAISAGSALAATPVAAVASAPCPMFQPPKGDVSRADQLKRMGEHFDLMDADHDGVLTAAERQAKRAEWQAQCPGRGGKRSAGPEGMPRMQNDIKRDDFMYRSGMMFDRMDADHNGVLTDAERAKAREIMRERHQARRASMPAAQ